MEGNVDEFVVRKAESSGRLEELLRVGRREEEMICEVGFAKSCGG